MNPSPTALLVSCLVAATLLGAGMGACVWHLRFAKRQRRALKALRERGERERQAFDAVLAQERERDVVRRDEARAVLERERAGFERAVARNDVLTSKAREQARLVELLQAEVLTLRGRRARSRNDPAGGDTGGIGATDDRRDDSRVPVLNRRVDTGSAGRARTPPAPPAGASSTPPAGGETDLPAPAAPRTSDAKGESVPDPLDAEHASGDACDR